MTGSILRVPSGKHSQLGASSAKRWMNCPGSINLINKLGDHAGRSGKEAARGTAAHTIAAMCLQNNVEPWEYGGTHIEVDGWKFVVDQEMLDSVTAYVDFVWTTATDKAQAGPAMFIERGMSSELHEDAYGTSDCIIYVPGDRIIIIDFKNGINIPVEPDDPQLSYYGYLAWENRPEYMKGEGKEPLVVEMWIAQPRCMHPQGPFRSHEMDVDELMWWFQGAVLTAMEATKEEDATLKMGEWCGFCPARDHCPELKKEALAYPLDVEPEELDEITIGLLLDKGEVLKKYIDKLQIVAFHRAQQGKKIPGRKLVRKISRRQWKVGAEDFLEIQYGGEVWESKLKSPAQVEKFFDEDPNTKDNVETWSMKPDSGLTLAARSDKRSEVTPLLEYDPMLFDEPIVADD